jgi:AhpD family alkylhydroperoxidase
VGSSCFWTDGAHRGVAPCEMEHFHQVTEDLRAPYRELSEAIPEVIAGFNALHTAAMAEGALSMRMKELIALAISITRECDGCISAHARGAARRGATLAEINEMIGVAISMNGGPGTVWGPRALAAFHEYADS